STSRDERSSITIEFNLTRDVDAATNDVRDRIGRVVGRLPDEVDQPRIAKQDSDADPVMWLNLSSDRMSVLELTDYAERVLIDRLSVVDGVAQINLGGARRFAMRIWLDRRALAARGLTVEDIEQALRQENVELPAGRLESLEREFTLRTQTGLETEQDFRALVVGRGADGFLVRLGEVADVMLDAENFRSTSRSNGVAGISMGIVQQSKANTVEISARVREVMEQIRPTLPEGMQIDVNNDRAIFINESRKEVFKAIFFALGLVLIVIYLFLGNLRALLVPAAVIPVSLIATFTVLYALGFSINVLTLLGLVLAIGLVVDDTIVVLENIYRRIEAGQQPLLAALDGSREIGFAVIATTLVLVAVFVPLSFMEGNIGRLFGEFGIALAAAVVFSSLVALTLVPMLCSKLFTDTRSRRGFTHLVDRGFRRMGEAYKRLLRRVVLAPWVVAAGALATAIIAGGLLAALPAEYAPDEDRGVIVLRLEAPEGASFEYTDNYTRRMEDVVMRYIETGEVRRMLARVPAGWAGTGEVNNSFAWLMLQHWNERERGVAEIADEMAAELADLPGVVIRVFRPRSLGIRGNVRPLSFVLSGGNYEEIAQWRDLVFERIQDNPGILGPNSDYDETKPQISVMVDRNRAADLGVSLSAVGRTLETALGSRVVTTFTREGQEYNVILQAREEDRASPTDLFNLYVRSSRSGELVPLANLIRTEERAGASRLNRVDRLRSISINAGLADGYALGDAIAFIERVVAEELPSSAVLSWSGVSLEFKESGQSLYFTFILTLLIVFLVLAAQFESFRHPMIIMTTVPLALTGGLLGLWLVGGSLNVFSQIGAVILVGLAAKNGVLIVEFANQLRDRGMTFIDAIVEASAVRLRPVLMTSMCTAFGAVPLILATGAGTETRQPLGVVIFYGVLLSMVLTLFVVPAFYALFARNTKTPDHVSRKIRALQDGMQPSGQA
ncbi:MAG: efflux RND transporter permease subunit, partial [Gammaproteobacteria bacterium]|nr:efflux RND transporter permease subunit [Gammaproteobacteria bacterium]